MRNNVRGHRINATPTIYNNLASFVSTLNVSLEDDTSLPIINVPLFCESTPYHNHSRVTKVILGIINLGRDGSNAHKVARIILSFCLNILEFFNMWIIHQLLNIFYLFIILLNDKGPRGTSSCDTSNPIAFEALEARA